MDVEEDKEKDKQLCGNYTVGQRKRVEMWLARIKEKEECENKRGIEK